MFKKLLLPLGIGFCSLSAQAEMLTVFDASVTKVQVYETGNDTANVWLHLNGSSTVGPNPVNPSTNCELWTNDKLVHSTALAALMAGKKVTVRYRDRGEGTMWCKVYDLSVTAG